MRRQGLMAAWIAAGIIVGGLTTGTVSAQAVRNPPPFRPGLPPTPPPPPGFPSRPVDFPRNRISAFTSGQVIGQMQGNAAGIGGQGGFGVGGQGGFGGLGGLGGGFGGGLGGLGGFGGGLGGLGGGFGGLGGGGFGGFGGGFGGGKQFGFDGGVFDATFRHGVGLLGNGSLTESGWRIGDAARSDSPARNESHEPTNPQSCPARSHLRIGKCWALPTDQ